jgi:hypothetical protein
MLLKAFQALGEKHPELPQTQSRSLLDAESGSRYTTLEPGPPGQCRKVPYEGPNVPYAVGPFYFPTGCVGIISRVGGERKV